jgi:glycosyltransferase involved in cell wall biosynthesis
MRVVLSHIYGWPEVRRGGERYLHELAAALAAAGHQVRVITTRSSPGREDILGVPVTYVARKALPIPRLGDTAEEAAFALQSGVRVLAGGADVWHALGTADAALAAGMDRIGILRSVHTSLGIPERWYRDSRPDHRLHDVVVRHVGAYVCLSDAAGRALEAGWQRVPLVVGGGVDLNRFAPAQKRHPRPALLYSGTFGDRRKNVALLLDGVGVLRDRGVEVELWLSGAGDPAPLLEAAPSAARAATEVLGVGTEAEQSGRYGRAWVTVLPSEHEAFGLALVESLACGTPVVALKEGGGPAEIVRPGTGYLCDRSAAALADACEAAFELSQQAGIAATCRARAQDFDWRRAIVPRFEAIYRDSHAANDWAGAKVRP